MRRFIPIFLIICLAFPKTQAEVQFYTALIGGSTSLDESVSGNTYDHKSQFFIGHLGAAFGGGYVFTTGVIGLGLKGELAWIGDSIDRKNSLISTDSKSYRFESQRLLSGIVFSLRPGPVAIDFEYYPWIGNAVSYSDKKAENPFRKSDTLKGTGLGVALAFKFFPPMRNFLMFRKISYKNVDMNGIKTVLPNDQYSTLTFDEILFGFGSEF